ncbi:carboxylating nicotinate-nucleotide diphosphorylase [Hyphococcus flavus]|uniref:Probable nicotinate-nucleotide pyrophosphorylase [carboxylating] n=1 Tax=Hyphococcus flavus TaxID=1866326 RepID=A0AAF0CDW1_9PROT|nr:carboxylating nicotinate-nucleotide diphosphorylase [Hyphococcus flavus]WDI30341.1 carboxylating nicotinate-nucleotide diphosphorylase [Hyphococcus flavus]
MNISPLSPLIIEDAVARALKEDFGDAGDITTNATIPAAAKATAVIAARKSGVIAGIDAAVTAFRMVDPSINVHVTNGDSTRVERGDAILNLEGSACGVLSAERVALNFLGHLSGIATATAALVDAVKGTNAKIVCTRKTTPGLRAFEKYAVRCGGGCNHRFGLYDAVMIKDNHIAAAGSIKDALAAARSAVGHTVKIEVEIDHLNQLDDALSSGADIVLLDNMTAGQLREAVNQTQGRAILEASGNITVETVRAIAETGVDVISSGWITHSAPSLDLGLDFE